MGFCIGASTQFIPSFPKSKTELTFNARPEGLTFPRAQPELERLGFRVAYDGRTRSPLWVYEKITKASLEGSAERSRCSFTLDPLVPARMQSRLADYRSSGFDPGHLAPAADNRASMEAMQESFYLTNIAPQLPEFNRGYWKRLENHVRKLAESYEQVEVVSGPLYLPKEFEGKKFVCYRVIGESETAVATHFFKVITATGAFVKKRWAYILPHRKIDEKSSLESFQVPLEELERVSGIIFN